MTLRLACSSRSAMRFLLENQSYLLCLAPRLCTFLFVSEPFWQPYGQYLWSGIKHKPSPRRPRRPRVVLSSFSAIQKENVRHCNNIVISVIPSDSNQTGKILRTQLKIAPWKDRMVEIENKDSFGSMQWQFQKLLRVRNILLKHHVNKSRDPKFTIPSSNSHYTPKDSHKYTTFT